MGSEIPVNRAAFDVTEIVAATGGRLRSGPRETRSEGVSTDTRTIVSNATFVALVGERFDGHRFVDRAVEAGASVVVVSRDEVSAPDTVSVVRVDDTLRALGALGLSHRRRWSRAASVHGARRVIAVGGSAGKTTTTRAIAALLDVCAPGMVHAPHGNLNNAIGVPMTLLGLEERHRFAVIEIGTNHRGEVAQLAAVTEPDDAVLTLIDLEHTEGIGTLDDVAVEEGDLVAAISPTGVAIGNADDTRVRAQLRRAPSGHVRTVGFDVDADVRIVSREPDGFMSRVAVARRGRVADVRSAVVDLPGEAGARATALAWTAAEVMLEREVEPNDVSRAMAQVAAVRDGRLNVHERGDGTVVIDDTYNANPASMRASIGTALEIAAARGARCVLVLGEMRELGAFSASEHDALGDFVARVHPAFVCAIAGDARRVATRAAAGGTTALFVPSSADAVDAVDRSVQRGDVILVKGSRGVATEAVVRHLMCEARSPGSSAPR